MKSTRVRLAGAALGLLALFSVGVHARDYHANGERGKDRPRCLSSPGPGQAACRTISYVVKGAKLAGHTVHVAAGTYRESVTIGPSDSGTAAKPVILTTDGAAAIIEGLDPAPLDDAKAVPCERAANCAGDSKAYPRVWKFEVANRAVEGVVETVWKDIRVDDSSVTGVIFDLTRPIPYYRAKDFSEVDRIAGSYFLDRGNLFVHTYGGVSPSTAANNVEIIRSETVVTVTGASHVTLDGFTVRFGGSNGVVVTEDSDHVTLKNLTVYSSRGVGVWISKRAGQTTIDRVDVSHVYNRKDFSNPDGSGSCYTASCGWHNRAGGTGLKIDGGSKGESGFTLREVTAYNAWNVVSLDRVSDSVFEDVLAKNSPNHTFIMQGENANSGSDPGNCTGNKIVRCMAFNGQDSFFIRGCTRGKLIRSLGAFDFFDSVQASTDGDSHGWTLLSSLSAGVNVQSMSHPGWRADHNWHETGKRSCRWTGRSDVDCRSAWPTQCACDRSASFGAVLMAGAQWPIRNGLEASRYTRADFTPIQGSSVIDAGSPDLEGDGIVETGPGGDDECTPARHCAGGRPDIGPLEFNLRSSKR